ncbi:MAG TPA: hypothetical protein VF870_12310 [Ignavibacteriaceae bacterium]
MAKFCSSLDDEKTEEIIKITKQFIFEIENENVIEADVIANSN